MHTCQYGAKTSFSPSSKAKKNFNNGVSPGQIIILNGAPRSGKTSIASVIVDSFEGEWQNVGVDAWMASSTPPELLPGIGLRPGGERPDLEPFVVQSYLALYEEVASLSRAGVGVIVDVGHHDGYSKSLGILPRCAKLLEGLPVLFIGVKCSLEEVLRRRGLGGTYLRIEQDGFTPDPVLRWQEAVHAGHSYDLEVDTTEVSVAASAELIRQLLDSSGGYGKQFPRIALGAS